MCFVPNHLPSKHDPTPYNWRNQAKSEGKPVPGAEKTLNSGLPKLDWRLSWKLILPTLNETEIAEYCRKKGLYPAQVAQWKQVFLQVPSADDKAALEQSQKENKQLKKELLRKEKAQGLLRGNGRG